VFVYSAMFGAGHALVGSPAVAALFAVLFLASGIVVARVLRRL
jgi:hypothetical protein